MIKNTVANIDVQHRDECACYARCWQVCKYIIDQHRLLENEIVHIATNAPDGCHVESGNQFPSERSLTKHKYKLSTSRRTRLILVMLTIVTTTHVNWFLINVNLQLQFSGVSFATLEHDPKYVSEQSLLYKFPRSTSRLTHLIGAMWQMAKQMSHIQKTNVHIATNAPDSRNVENVCTRGSERLYTMFDITTNAPDTRDVEMCGKDACERAPVINLIFHTRHTRVRFAVWDTYASEQSPCCKP